MRYVEFGEHRDRASVVALGLMRIRDKSESHVNRLIHTALDVGINMLDTAPIYGASETLVGAVLKAEPALREHIILQTKVGIANDPDRGHSYYDFSKQHILESVDRSLMALHTDYVDSLLLHRPDVLMEPEEVAEAFSILHTSGKVRNFGVSNQNPALMELLNDKGGIRLIANQVQLSIAFAPAFDALFNINRGNAASLMRDGGMLEYCRRKNIIIQAWSVLQFGNMDGSFLEENRYCKLNDALQRIALKYGVEPIAVAVAWVLRYPGPVQAVIGTTRPERVKAASMAADVVLTRSEWYELYRAAGRDIP